MTTAALWCVLPAAGIGQRMAADRPKQYLPLQGRTLLEVTLQRLHQAFPASPLYIPLHPQDHWWPAAAERLQQHCPNLQLVPVPGGQERADSVLSALQALEGLAAADDWVLVHDVARPCVTPTDLHNLWSQLHHHPVGGLLAAPVADTMKRSDAQNQVLGTVDRQQLWHALTPQIFRYGLLKAALQQALQQGLTITDEASALEAAGYQPLLVTGRRDNIKITHPEDLPLAELLLQSQQQG
ncbi:2-C-methyl-D-erythritol 4-phosphate cytidylyltransferase [Marinospirillum alkaliphilum]|uniref:2-C-methyl-D-erythritol 4-phosphate cytidylyltransferase n=1 Tax=Marinospirillum alkaliphilum DSM 21637 TaxID=1122209 RepID=A0A1K1V9P5_9GAMM|nr:2-C-methyl-D-erythritol 4-phosphate cytidylyltransferase [Marinospirillum alkaliphilum]SFX21862.1 2-C-methyl-D-erythritol 4-phosphate cytidylyltransferase [Marinospirillum alkaliphilum DSM 21637]